MTSLMNNVLRARTKPTLRKITNDKQLGKTTVEQVAQLVFQNVIHHKQFDKSWESLTEADMVEYLTRVLESNREYLLVAFRDDVPVGIAVYYTFIRFRTKTVWVMDLVVDINSRGENIGSLLLDELGRIEKGKLPLEIGLQAYTKNVNAIRFYKDNGMSTGTVNFTKRIE